MAWFRRKRDEDVAEEAPAEAPSDASHDVVRAERSHAGDWMAVPPMPMTVGPPPTSFRVQRVSEIMTTRRPIAFYGQLGHQVSASAPAGHVEGLTTTVAPPTAAPHPIDLPLHAHGTHDDHGDHAEPSPAGGITSAPASDAKATPPPVQRSVRDLAPDEPVTAQTLGVSRQAIPVVQRSIAASPAPAASAGPARPSLPEPTPTRVLREPTRAPSPLETRVPSIPVVGEATPPPAAPAASMSSAAPVAGDASSSNDFYEPDTPMEFVVRAGDPSPAPLAGDVPLQRAADTASSRSPSPSTEDAGGGTTLDLPLAAPVAPSPSAAPDPSPSPSPAAAGSDAPSGGELMPPIQPRSIQRRATEAAAAVAPTAGLDDNGLPPLPSWAVPASADAGSATNDSPSRGETMPLHATSPAPAAATTPTAAAVPAPGTPAVSMQREVDGDGEEHFEGDGHDHGADGVVQREADGSSAGSPPAPADRAGDDAHSDDTAPLLGDRPLVDLSSDSSAEPGSPAAEPIDLPLQVPAATAPASDAVAASSVQREAEGGAPRSADAEPTRVAPLLGERPLQLQRVAETAGPSPAAAPASAPTNPLSLPLVADVAAGPQLDRTPQSPSAPSGNGSTAPIFDAPVQRSAATTASSPSSSPAAPATTASQLPLRTLAASPGGPVAAATSASGAAVAGAATAPLFASSFVTPAQQSALTTITPVAVQTERDAPSPAMPLQEPVQPSGGDTSMLLGDAAVAAGLARRDSDGSVVFHAGGAANGGSTSLPIQREAAGGFSTVDPTGGPSSFVVQRAEEPTASVTTTPAAATPAVGNEDTEADELAAKVYDRIRWKLAADLRADQRRLGASQWKGR